MADLLQRGTITDNQAGQYRELSLYRQLRREGSRLQATLNQDDLFGELIRIGAFNNPPGGRTRLNANRRIIYQADFRRHRTEGRVYRLADGPGDRFRGGSWLQNVNDR